MIWISLSIFFLVIGVSLFLALNQPKILTTRERRRRIAVERLCAQIIEADQNPMWAIPPRVTELASEIIESKDLNP